MSSVIRNTRVVFVLVLLSAGFACGAASATVEDELLVDPTRPLSSGSEEAGDTAAENSASPLDVFNMFTRYELSSVLIRSGDRIAVINDERVRVGDEIGAAVVASIESDHVTLNVDGEIQTVQLYAESIKTPVKGDD